MVKSRSPETKIQDRDDKWKSPQCNSARQTWDVSRVYTRLLSYKISLRDNAAVEIFSRPQPRPCRKRSQDLGWMNSRSLEFRDVDFEIAALNRDPRRDRNEQLVSGARFHIAVTQARTRRSRPSRTWSSPAGSVGLSRSDWISRTESICTDLIDRISWTKSLLLNLQQWISHGLGLTVVCWTKVPLRRALLAFHRPTTQCRRHDNGWSRDTSANRSVGTRVR